MGCSDCGVLLFRWKYITMPELYILYGVDSILAPSRTVLDFFQALLPTCQGNLHYLGQGFFSWGSDSSTGASQINSSCQMIQTSSCQSASSDELCLQAI